MRGANGWRGGADRISRAPKSEEMAALDQLPKAIRDELHNAPLPISPISVLDHYRANGGPQTLTAVRGMIGRTMSDAEQRIRFTLRRG
jgi:hypothetical protein